MSWSVSLPEHGELRLRLTPEQAETLRGCRLRVAVEKQAVGLYSLKAGRWVGTEAVGDLILRVVPKLPADRLLHILAAGGVRLTLGPAGALGAAGETVGVLQRLYAAALRRALSWGLLRDYRGRTADLDAVRGRLDLESLVTRRFGVFPPIPCEFDEHTHDIEGNRRLRAAAWLLSRVPGDSGAASELGAQARDLGGLVAPSVYRGPREPLHVGSLADRQLGRGAEDYRTALRLAELALTHGRLSFDGTTVSSPSFAVNMDKAFERFVSTALRTALGVPVGSWLEEPTRHLDRQRTVRLRPDIVWKERGGVRLVVDAKWKATEGALSADLRQVALYCQALGASRAVLVYGDVARPRHIEVVRSNVVIRVVSLSLEGPVVELDARIARLAGELRSFSAPGPRADLRGTNAAAP